MLSPYLFALSLVWSLAAGQQELPPAQDDSPADKSPAQQTPAAVVDGEAITSAEVQHEVDRAAAGRKIEPEAMTVLRARAVQQLIDQRLVLQYLKRHKLAASQADVRLSLDRLRRQLTTRQLTLEEYLKQSGRTEASLRRTLVWQVSWRRYLDRYMTDENLQKYFEKNRRHFDGSTMRVAHVLFKASQGPAEVAANETRSKLIAQAKELRTKIESGQLTFEEAAQRHSAAPTAEKGGDLGWIERHQPMPEVFSLAAFRLKTGQVSEPVVSPFGVHLIMCREIKPGQKTWKEVRQELERAVSQYLFRWVADRQRPHSEVLRDES